MNRNAKVISIEKIDIDKKFYPRFQTDKQRVRQFVQAMEYGEFFEPIKVVYDKKTGRYILLDGKHRMEAKIIRGETKIEVYILDIPEEHVLLNAARLNDKSPKPLTRDLIPDLEARLKEKDFNPLVLRSTTVSKEKRENWVKSKLASGEFNVMITNPNLIKTGLDLLEFPSIIFFQTGYSIFTLRQASRRSWRIGQDAPVWVFYLFYGKTMQSVALSLIATKMETALAIEGDLSDRGLTALAEGANSMLIEMARVLTGEQDAAPVSDTWKRYKKKELVADTYLGDDVLEAEVSTTTFVNSDHSADITYDKIFRGKVFPRNGYAVAVVDNNEFLFEAGRILFKGKPCGTYDKKGMGTINNKAIQIMKSDQLEQECFVLVEIR